MGPPIAVAACRTAVRSSLRDLVDADDALVLVAVSGGADSLSLLSATSFVAVRMGLRFGVVTVDHGLQAGSAHRCRDVAVKAVALGADPVSIWHVTVDGSGGPEAAARRARYEALERAAQACGARTVLLAHTRDDQAETVLLGLARGSGSRSLAGMSARVGLFRRPLLGLSREVVAEAAAGLGPWDDPQNADPAFARVRVRHQVLPVLEREIGPGIAAALGRSATLLRADADALDEWAQRAAGATVHDGVVDAIGVSVLPTAVRTRVLRRAALAAGAPASDLSSGHVAAMDALVMGESGGMSVDLPGRVSAVRSGGRLHLTQQH